MPVPSDITIDFNGYFVGVFQKFLFCFKEFCDYESKQLNFWQS